MSCLAASGEGKSPPFGGVDVHQRTWGFDTITESAQRPRGKGSFIPPAWEANEELATKALVSMVKVCAGVGDSDYQGALEKNGLF